MNQDKEENTFPEWQPRPIAKLTEHKKIVFSLAFSPDREHMASGSSDKTIRIWNIPKKCCETTLEGHKHQVYTVAFSPDGKTLASGSWDKTICIWDATRWERIASVNSKDFGGIIKLVFSPDGKRLASITGGPSCDVTLWSLSPIREFATLIGHKSRIHDIDYSPSGHLLASASSDDTAILWDVDAKKENAVLEGHKRFLECVTFSPDGRLCATGAADGEAIIWEVPTGKRIKVLSGHKNGVNCVRFSPCGRYLFVGYGEFDVPGFVKVWSMDTFNTIETIQCHDNGIVRCISISKDKKILATGSSDGAICLWDYAEFEKHLREAELNNGGKGEEGKQKEEKKKEEDGGRKSGKKR